MILIISFAQFKFCCIIHSYRIESLKIVGYFCAVVGLNKDNKLNIFKSSLVIAHFTVATGNDLLIK